MAKFVCNFISSALKRTVDITVIIPSLTFPEACGDGAVKGVIPRHRKEEKYPVLYLLHGLGNNHATWSGYTNVELYAEERNLAVVMISGENKMYVNQSDDPFKGDHFYDFIEDELPDFVQQMFPVSDKPEDTYLAGLSMGAIGTLVHGLKYPEKYRALGAFSSGLYVPPTEIEGWNPQLEPMLLTAELEKKGIKGLKIFMGCGDRDHLFESCQKSVEILRDSGQDVTWVPIEGYIHEWRVWDQLVELFMDWLPRTDYFSTLGKRKI